MTYQYVLNGLHCANCAQKIETNIQKETFVENAELNFVTKKLTLVSNEKISPDEMLLSTKALVNKLEPDVLVVPIDTAEALDIEYVFEGLNCSGCAAKIETRLQETEGLKEVVLDFVSKKLYVSAESFEYLSTVDQTVEKAVHFYEPDVHVSRFVEDMALPTHGHEHTHDHKHEKKKPFNLDPIRLGLGAVIFALGFVIPLNETGFALINLVAYVLVGAPVIVKAFKGLRTGQLFDENFLMVVATFGAIGIREWREAVAVMLFYEVGEAFQNRAVDNSRKSIKNLLNIKPETAVVIDGLSTRTVKPEQVLVGQKLLVKPGEKIPLDGVVLSGESTLDTSALTGESIPRAVAVGEPVLSGSVNLNQSITVEVTKPFKDSTVARIMKLVEHSAAKKSATEQFITRFARYYTPAVVFSALALAVLPPLLTGGHWNMWIERALIFLVVSCPCALVVSIPLGYFGGIGAASKKGILIKGGQYLDALHDVKTVVFDKTGTLTEGQFEVKSLHPVNNTSEKQLLEWAAVAECQSNHPIAISIMERAKEPVDMSVIESYEELAGHGIKANILAGAQSITILAGNKRLMDSNHISLESVVEENVHKGTIVYIAVDNILKGYIQIADKPKVDVLPALNLLRKARVSHIEMLTGDTHAAAQLTAESLNIDHYQAELLPEDKVFAVEALQSELDKSGKLAFVGDGVNDAPVLARADVGIAMGALGSDAAIEAADVVLMTDEPSKLYDAIRISKYTRKIVMQNIIFALGIKLAVLALGAFGMATMWSAVFADVGVAVLAVLNASRILRI